MAKQNSTAPDLRGLVDAFVGSIVAAVESAAAHRVQSAVTAALGQVGLIRRGPGRPPKNALAVAPARTRPHKKQLCPVPGCKNPAAPVFGMVCAEHKNVPKAKIRKYREQRRARKESGAQARPGRKRGRPAKKAA
jgi:hypothetical protein